MFAREVFSSHPARPHAPRRFPSKSFVSPTSRITARNSFVSPTYAKTGGCTPLKMSARRHFLSLCPQSPFPALFLFNRLRTLSFSVSHVSAVLPTSSALLSQKPGAHPLWSNQSHGLPPNSDRVSSLWAVNCRLVFPLAPSPHSSAIHKAVTGPSPMVLPGLSQWTAVR